MTMTKLGEFLKEGEGTKDAVHVCIAPVVAAEALKPGDHVCFVEDNNTSLVGASWARPKVGVVDPFLTRPIREGESFNMLLYPGTTSGLRHEWSHPAFPEIEKEAPTLGLGLPTLPTGLDRAQREAFEWLKNFCEERLAPSTGLSTVLLAAARIDKDEEGCSC